MLTPEEDLGLIFGMAALRRTLSALGLGDRGNVIDAIGRNLSAGRGFFGVPVEWSWAAHYDVAEIAAFRSLRMPDGKSLIWPYLCHAARVEDKVARAELLAAAAREGDSVAQFVERIVAYKAGLRGRSDATDAPVGPADGGHGPRRGATSGQEVWVVVSPGWTCNGESEDGRCWGVFSSEAAAHQFRQKLEDGEIRIGVRMCDLSVEGHFVDAPDYAAIAGPPASEAG